MKKVKIFLAILLVGSIAILSFSCGSATANNPTESTFIVDVSKGDISLAVTGIGNLAFAILKDLSFETAGAVEEVMVKAGQTVKEGQELARLDSSQWEEDIKKLEKALETAENNLAARKTDLSRAERQVPIKEMDFRLAQISHESMKKNFSRIPEVKAAYDLVETLEQELKNAQASLSFALTTGNTELRDTLLEQINDRLPRMLEQAQQKLQSVLSGTSITLSEDVNLQIVRFQIDLEKSEMALEDAEAAIGEARMAITSAQKAVKEAEQSLLDAQTELEEARNISMSIKAPFNGFITKVDIVGGQEVPIGKMAIQIADPTRFKADFFVSETDIFSIMVGQRASVAVDAMPGFIFPAQITDIAQLANTQQGIVNYQVTAELTSLQPVVGQVDPGLSESGNAMPLPIFGDKGNVIIPPVQVEVRPDRVPSGEITTVPKDLPTVIPDRVSPDKPGSGRVPGISSVPGSPASGISLKDGLTVIVSITLQEKKGVIIVPNRAITRQAGENTVQVIKGNTTETRVVKTGLADSSNTEIIEGLTEGEQIEVKTSSSSGIFRMGGAVIRQEAVRVR
jgi:multidrug efflux pump subunit AcrA (membrane-fusion protein)